MNTEKLLDTQDVLQRLHVSRKTLYALMERGVITPVETPAYLKRRPKLQFRESEVQRVLESGSPAKDEEPHAA